MHKTFCGKPHKKKMADVSEELTASITRVMSKHSMEKLG
jgi:hypothetical protein